MNFTEILITLDVDLIMPADLLIGVMQIRYSLMYNTTRFDCIGGGPKHGLIGREAAGSRWLETSLLPSKVLI